MPSLEDLKNSIRAQAGIKPPKITISGETVVISKKCLVTEGDYSVSLPLATYEAWRAGALIQNVAPDLTAEQREFLISFNTPAEWYELMGTDEDEF